MRAHGILNAAGNDEDEHGFHLILLFDSDDCDCEALDLRVGFQEGQELLKALEPLRDWVNEGLREHAAYQRGEGPNGEPPGTWEVVCEHGFTRLTHPNGHCDSGYELSDPKHPDFHSVHSDLWDNRDKTKERP